MSAVIVCLGLLLIACIGTVQCVGRTWNERMCQSTKDDLSGHYSEMIKLIGDRVLDGDCQEVPMDAILNSDPEMCKEVGRLHYALSEFRRSNGFGRAIAAPQIGYAYRVIALNLDGKLRTLFNPEITYRSDDMFTMWDDCLSFPHLMVSVKRHKSISMLFTNEVGQTEEWNNLDQATSELLQHEIDHLDGTLAVQLATPIKDANGNELSAPIIDRSEWLANRDWYESIVDYGIAIAVPPN